MLFIDLETIPDPEGIASDAWKRKQYKARLNGKQLTDHEASFDPCFGKILCIVAAINAPAGPSDWIMFAEVDTDEKALLERFDHWWTKGVFEGQTPGRGLGVGTLCAHNGKNFDYPFLAKRYLAHGMKLPEALRFDGKKPWEIQHKDTMEILQFGSFMQKTSLDSACHLLGIPTPKEGIDGSQVWQAHKDGLDKDILEYCKRDVQALCGVYSKLKKLGACQ